MVNQNKVINLEIGGAPAAISSAHFRFTDVSQVSLSLLGHRLLVFQPIPNGALEVLRKAGFEEPSRSPSMKQLVGGETRRRAPREFMVRTAQGTRRTQSLVRSCFIKIRRFCCTTGFVSRKED